MSQKLKTQIGIIGAGPAGLMLAHFLDKMGIESIVLENKSRDYVENRIRAGLLEQNTVDYLKEIDVADNLLEKGLLHEGVNFSFDGERIHIPFGELTGGRNITIYGQRFVVRDLIRTRLERGGEIRFEAEATKITDIDADQPKIYFTEDGEEKILECDFVAACDGYHGVGRETLPTKSYRRHDIHYPFSWLGIMANAAPSSDELIYSYHKDGFALLSYRSPTVSRLYLQVDNDDDIDNWSDDRIWDNLHKRLAYTGWTLNEGEITQKGITPMRSYMIDHMQHKKLFVAGDAAHIVPPTGGKGLNLAVADVKIMSKAFEDFYKNNSTEKLDNYSSDAMRRVWRAQGFSNFMTTQFHKQYEHGSYEYLLQKANFDYIAMSTAMKTTIAENYVGLKHI